MLCPANQRVRRTLHQSVSPTPLPLPASSHASNQSDPSSARSIPRQAQYHTAQQALPPLALPVRQREGARGEEHAGREKEKERGAHVERRTLRRFTRQAGEAKGIMACITMPIIVYVGYLLNPSHFIAP